MRTSAYNANKVTYIKFAMIGLTGAGTTSFIQTVTEINELENRERLALARYSAEYTQIKLGLLPKAQDQWEIVLGDKIGILIMIDSTKPETFAEVRANMRAVREYASAPFIVLANKQDHPLALTTDEIRHKLGVSSETLVLPCIAKDKGSITRVIIELTNWAQSKHG